MSMVASLFDRNKESTLFVSNLDPRVTEEHLWELFTQTGPVVSVFLPRDKVSLESRGHAFVECRNETESAYSAKILNHTKLFGRPIKIAKSAEQKGSRDIGANLFVGNLDPSTTEKDLYTTFSHFGTVTACKVVQDPLSYPPKAYAHLSFDSFEASDQAILRMNKQILSDRVISVEYALKKDSRGARHGSNAERLLAANRQVGQDLDMFWGSAQVDYGKVHQLVLPNLDNVPKEPEED